jgi:hypothetical protein
MEEAPKAKLILLTDIIEQKLRKEKELEFYQKELEKLQEKMYWLGREISLNETIIRVIENEQIIDIKEGLSKKLLERSDE